MTIQLAEYNPRLNGVIAGTGASSTPVVIPQPTGDGILGNPQPRRYSLLRICNPNASPVAIAYANGTSTATATATGTAPGLVVNGNSVEKFRCSFAPLSLAAQYTTGTATGNIYWSLAEGE